MLRTLPTAATALLIALIAAGTVGAALLFEYAGYAPCPLCLQERWPYFIGVPVSLAVSVAARHGSTGRMAFAGMIMLALLFAGSAGLGAYHAGIEWKLWAGPSGCSGGSIVETAGSLMGQLQGTARVSRCDEASWRFLGLSFAGWNAVISLALAIMAATAALRRHGSSSVSQ